jgi:ABC-type multidrug transport system ATPase subunit
MDEAELCGSVGFIDQGRLIATGSPAAIKSRAFGRIVVEVAADYPGAAAELLSDWDAVEEVVRAEPGCVSSSCPGDRTPRRSRHCYEPADCR